MTLGALSTVSKPFATGLASSPRPLSFLLAQRPPTRGVLRSLCTAKKAAEPNQLVERARDAGGTVATPSGKFTADGLEVREWGSSVELPAVTKEQAQESFLDATDVKRAITPPTGLAMSARDDMVKDRFNYVSTNLRPEAQYVVMGSHGKVAPVAISQSAVGIASLLVLMGAVTAVVYVKKEMKVSSFKELGDKLRESGAARKARMEDAGATKLVRTISQKADDTVKGNVDLIRRPTQQMGTSLNETFQGSVLAPKPKKAADSEASTS